MFNLLKPYELNPKGQYFMNWLSYLMFVFMWPMMAMRILRDFWFDARAKGGIVFSIFGLTLMTLFVLLMFTFYTVTGPIAALLNLRPSIAKPN